MRRVLWLFVAAAFCALALWPAPVGGQRQGPAASHKLLRAHHPIPNQYIVVLNEDFPGHDVPAVAEEMSRAHGGSIRFVYDSVPKGFSVELPEAAAVRLSHDPRVAYIEENAMGIPGTTQLNPPWGLDRIDQRSGRDNRYTYNATGTGVHAYILDSGIRTTHVEFGGRATLDARFVSEFCEDCLGHGTAVAAVLGGSTYGVAKNVRLHGLKVCDALRVCPDDAMMFAVNWVTAHHIKPAVANISVAYSGDRRALNDAVRASINAGVTYTILAGNFGEDANLWSPGRVIEALTVGASNINDVRRFDSNIGSVVDLFAPGDMIPTAGISSDTEGAIGNGTSVAAPHVAGVAALILENNPGATPASVHAAIVNNATLGAVSDTQGTPNRLLFSPVPTPTPTPTPTTTPIPTPTPPQPSSTGRPVPKDYDGDGRADIAVKTDDGRWRIDYAANGFGPTWDQTLTGHGGPDGKPAPADYDGDGRADVATKFDNGNWSIDFAANGFGAFDATFPGYGLAESRPAPADYDGDGRADLSCHSTGTGQWRIDFAANGFGVWDQTLFGYGGSENREAVADYDGDFRADVAIHSITQGRWNIDYAWNGFGSWNVSVVGYGFAVNREAPADYDGDGRADIAVKSDDQGRFNIDFATNGFGSWNASFLGYGLADTQPAPGDYDGDGRADFAVKSDSGQWRIDYAANGFGAFDQTINLQP